MEAAYKSGINIFDCAEGYADGESERIVGLAIKKFGWKRNDIVVSIKIYFGTAHSASPVNNLGLSRQHIIEGVEGSLERLGLDYVDLVYAHRPDTNTPIEETVRAFNHVIAQGKAFYWGTSEWSAPEIATAWGVARRLGMVGPLMEQPCYNIVESEYVHLYAEYGMGLTTYSPLSSGILTGKYNDQIPADSCFADRDSKESFIAAMNRQYGGEDWTGKLDVVRNLNPVAERLGCTIANQAYAWILKNRRISSAITGASRPQQIYDAVKCFDTIKLLTPEVMEEIEGILGNKPVS
ncbi:putative voltage-gated potassium channel subunit beta [Lachnellula subtilissima]|uniref:Putative voltage-gated potassium channel subunit beta n=1 Tax=Lachnellula subtilissima TaxID=602034 RepID=A0A8H8S1P1_9HELO|nr:putative voltage-gated potassium channel subunit beta [Lachnellula subtilissima]